MELSANVLDIQSFDDKDGGWVDLWKNDRERKAQLVRKVKNREEQTKPAELENEKVDSKEEVENDEKATEVKKDEKAVTSVWELLIVGYPR